MEKLDQINPPPSSTNQEIKVLSQAKKKIRKLKDNPFEDLEIMDEDQKPQEKLQNPLESQWIKPKTTPLTISISDFSRINKYYSHKSLQKYIQYLFADSCPNPMWLSIKRKSQVERIVFIDIQIENNLFHRHFGKNQTHSLQNIPQHQDIKGNKILNFLPQFDLNDKKAIFKESIFIQNSRDLWDAVFVYDEQAVKNEIKAYKKDIELPTNLTQQIVNIYKTYTLSADQMKFNLYPIEGLPAFQQYFKITNQNKEIALKNRILVVDCEMVMCGSNFELARASIMNFEGELIYDQFFKPDCKITNYNTQFSGITEEILKDVTKNVKHLHEDLIRIIDVNTILIGHSLENDLHAMKMIHQNVIDTSVLFARKNGSKMKLKTLSYQILNRSIQVNTHCSEQDCKATLDIVRQKIQASFGSVLDENKEYHLLSQLQNLGKKIVFIDSDMSFMKHRKQFLGIQFDEIEFNEQNQESFIGKFGKYFDKNVKTPELILSRIRKISEGEEWEDYYIRVDKAIEKIYEKSIEKTVFFLNFQVNNSVEIYPQNLDNILERRRPFCIFAVKP